MRGDYMTTKTFSSRVDETVLAYMDALTRQQFGMSYGQYCGSVLIEAIREGAELPRPSSTDEAKRKESAIATMKAFSKRVHDEAVGRMTDEEIKDLIADRYE